MFWLGLLALVALAMLAMAPRRRTSWVLATLMLTAVLFSTSCASRSSGNSGTPSGTSTLTITGTFTQNSATVVHTAKLTLVVQ